MRSNRCAGMKATINSRIGFGLNVLPNIGKDDLVHEFLAEREKDALI
jgi:hypothetical protein